MKNYFRELLPSGAYKISYFTFIGTWRLVKKIERRSKPSSDCLIMNTNY